MTKIYHFVTICTLILILSSCTTQTPIPLDIKEPVQKNLDFKIKMSNEGEHLFNILINKKTKKFVKKIKLKQKYNKKRYELIKVYSRGLYPSFPISEIKDNKSSIFKDNTFNKVAKQLNLDNNTPGAAIVYPDIFDKEKFLKISQEAMNALYANTKLSVELLTNKNINAEYSRVELIITHKPTVHLEIPQFFINASAMLPELVSNKELSLIKQKRIYKLPIPTGNNHVKVKISSLTGEKADDNETVKNSFTATPALYVLAIGVNEFAKWGEDKTLKNAVNDAQLLKETFADKGGKLFKQMSINPHTLSVENTSKANIDKIIQEIRQKIKPNDYFVFYVASHGILENNEYYFAPSDFEWDVFIENGVEEDKISDYLINIPTIFRMAILDTCHSGRQVDVIKRDIKNLPLGRTEGISILTATKSEQIANDKYKGHGLFTYLLAEGLNGPADYNGDSIVDSIEIAQYVQSHVGNLSRAKTSIEQDAVILPNPKDSYSKRFELTFLEKKEFKGFQPSVFTPRESELYISAIQSNDPGKMDGIVRNNTRQHYNRTTPSIDGDQLTVEKIIAQLKLSESVDIDISFVVGSARLARAERKKVDIIGKALQSTELKSKRVLLGGHTDDAGTDESNMALSEKRAAAIAKRLDRKFGISRDRVTPIGYGEIYPVAENETVKGKKKNRRVSIFIYE